MNPNAIARYRDRIALGGTNTDRLDARGLASIWRTDRAAHRPLAPDSARTRDLRLVTRDLAELEKPQTMLAHQRRAALLAALPAAVAVFRDLTAPSTLGVLRTVPPRGTRHPSGTAMAVPVANCPPGGRPWPATRCLVTRRWCRPSAGSSPPWRRPGSTLPPQIRTYDKRLHELWSDHPARPRSS
jgi:hypothetical protein